MPPSRNIWSVTLDEDIDTLNHLLEDGVHVDERSDIGETPLHLAARHGLEFTTKALLVAGANVNLRDWESGWTPLHRSLYFGHVRVSLLLIQGGALVDGGRDQFASVPSGGNRKVRSRSRSESVESASAKSSVRSSVSSRWSHCLSDHDGNTPLDILSLELRPQLSEARKESRGGDVYSFGKADFFLGYDSFGKADVVTPRWVEALANLHVVRLAASRYHSAAVTLDGRLYTWGHGRGGRLGHGNEDICMLPTTVEGLANKRVVEVAASETHTAALTDDGELFTWGRDRFGQVLNVPGNTSILPLNTGGLGVSFDGNWAAAGLVVTHAFFPASIA